MDGMDQLAQMFRTPAQQRAFQDFQKVMPFVQQMKAQKAAAAQQQRTAPVTNALSSLGQQWQTATTDEGRNTAHSLADKTRSAYLTGGGSPADLGQQYWGSDPTQGFEGTGGFSAPITGYEGLARKDTVDYTRDALAAELKRRLDEAGLTGVDPQTGQATLEGKYKNYLMSKISGGSGGGSGGGGLTQTDAKNQNFANALMQIQPKLDAAWAADGWAGAVDALPQIIAEIQANKPFLASGGVNTDDLVDYVYQTLGGFIKKGGKWIPDDGSGSDANVPLVGNPQ